MTVAIVLIIVAVIALLSILVIAIPRSRQVSGDSSLTRIEPLDIEAFRNLVSPLEHEYLRRRLPPSEFRKVQRERLRAAAAYVRVARRNAAVLIAIGQPATASSDASTAEAAHELVDNALRLRSNTTTALLRIYVALLWPQSSDAGAPVLIGYEQLSGRAMLLGRLQNPAVPVRISVNL